jgi:hypothetical protein
MTSGGWGDRYDDAAPTAVPEWGEDSPLDDEQVRHIEGAISYLKHDTDLPTQSDFGRPIPLSQMPQQIHDDYCIRRLGGDARPVSTIEAIRTTLRRAAEKNESSMVFRDEEGELQSIDCKHKWAESMQKRDYAKNEGMLRETVGGERPSGEITEGKMDNPHVALLGLTGRSKLEGSYLPPADHAQQVKDAWADTYQAIRNRLRSLGFDSEDWLYFRGNEPHPGDGQNKGYYHEHPVLVIDGEVDTADFKPVMEKYVESCELADMGAHTPDPCDSHSSGDPWHDIEPGCSDCKSPVSVRGADEIDNPGAYVSHYLSKSPDPLIERSPEFLFYASYIDGSCLDTNSRSNEANAAAAADRCKREADGGDHDDHGSYTVLDDGEHKCYYCESSWGIEQDKTLTEHRLEEDSETDSEGAERGAERHGGEGDTTEGDRGEETHDDGVLDSGSDSGWERYGYEVGGETYKFDEEEEPGGISTERLGTGPWPEFDYADATYVIQTATGGYEEVSADEAEGMNVEARPPEKNDRPYPYTDIMGGVEWPKRSTEHGEGSFEDGWEKILPGRANTFAERHEDGLIERPIEDKDGYEIDDMGLAVVADGRGSKTQDTHAPPRDYWERLEEGEYHTGGDSGANETVLQRQIVFS